MQEIMETAGFDFSQVFSEMIKGMRNGRSPKKLRGPARCKYRDPESGKTWFRKGRIPQWLKPHLEDGKAKEDFLIDQERTEIAAK